MSYSHLPEASAKGLEEILNDRICDVNVRMQWEDGMPKVKTMGEYRKNGQTNINFLVYDSDFFVPIVRLDLLEKYNKPLPNAWAEVVALAVFFPGKDLNNDGNDDNYSFYHFPRLGAGFGGRWWPKAGERNWSVVFSLGSTMCQD